jgi:hypothetical protein
MYFVNENKGRYPEAAILNTEFEVLMLLSSRRSAWWFGLEYGSSVYLLLQVERRVMFDNNGCPSRTFLTTIFLRSLHTPLSLTAQ